MSRYIDAELLEPDTEWDDYEDGYVSYSKHQIKCAKTADVVEVVRCKDCKHFDRAACPMEDVVIYPDDYCSYGERA